MAVRRLVRIRFNGTQSSPQSEQTEFILCVYVKVILPIREKDVFLDR